MHRADEPCVIRSRAARGNSRGEKAVGEAVSFPYRLITNDFLALATGEAPALDADAVSELNAVPR